MSDEQTESEREQTQRLVTLQKVVFIILARWAWLFALLFVVLFAAFASYLASRSSKSVGRYTATTRLLYNPRKVADIETISDKQIMSILDRASLKRRIGEKIQMTQAEKVTPHLGPGRAPRVPVSVTKALSWTFLRGGD